MKTILPLIMAFATVAGSAIADPSTNDELRAVGAFNRTPVTQAMMASEAEWRRGYLSQNASVARQTAERLEAIRAGKQPPAFDDSAQKQAVINMAEALDRAAGTYTVKRRLTQGAVDAHQDLFKVLDFGGGLKVNTELGATMVLGATERNLQRRIENYLGEMPELQKSVSNALALGLLETQPSMRAKWMAASITEENVKQASTELFGNQNAFFATGLGSSLPSDVKQEIVNARVSVIKGALERVVAQQAASTADQAAFRTQAEQRFTVTQQQIATAAKDYREFRKQFVVHAQAVEGFMKATDATLTAVQQELSSLSGSVATLDARTRGMEMSMWRRMDEREKLQALRDGFMPGLGGAQRAAVITDLAATVRVYDARDTALKFVDGAAGVVKLAAGMGVPIDVANANRTLSQVSSAVNVASSLMTGNFWGAAMQMGGLFGSGGEDPSTAQFKQLNAKLDRIIELQIATLKRIDELSQQIETAHQEVMSKLATIEAKVDFTAEIVAAAAIQPKDYQGCVLYLQEASRRGMSNGVYDSYEARKEHFDRDWTNNRDFERCRQFLASSVQMRVLLGAYVDAPVFFWAQAYDSTNVGSFSLPRQHAELWRATMLANGVDPALRPNCARRLLNLLMSAPMHFRSVDPLDCRTADRIVADTVPFTIFTGAEVSPSAAMQRALAPGAVRHVGEAVLFFAPYSELAVVSGGAQRLFTARELASGALPEGSLVGAGFTDFRNWPEQFLDVVNLTVGQTTLRSGAMLVPHIVATMKVAAFGAKASYKDGDTDLAVKHEIGKDGYCVPEGTQQLAWDKAAYLFGVCLLQKYPELNANAARLLVYEGARASRISNNFFSFALKAGNDRFLRESALPSLPTLARDVESRTGWAIAYKDLAQKDATLDVPTATEVWSGQISHSPGAEAILDLRDRIEARLASMGAHSDVVRGNDKGAEWMLRQAALRNPTLIEVPITTFPLPARNSATAAAQ